MPNLPKTADTTSTIACIIPAHNEQKTIEAVIHEALRSDMFDHITVVNDASTDYTGLAARFYEDGYGVHVESLPRRLGKSHAVAHGLRTTPRAKFVCLLDADLIGLEAKDIINLVKPVALGVADVSFSRRGKGSGLWPGLDILTGERVMPWWMLEACRLETCSSMGMEMTINDAIITHGMKVAVVRWPGVANPTKREKYGWRVGWREELGMYRDLFKKGVWTLAKQTRRLNQQRVQGS